MSLSILYIESATTLSNVGIYIYHDLMWVYFYYFSHMTDHVHCSLLRSSLLLKATLDSLGRSVVLISLSCHEQLAVANDCWVYSSIATSTAIYIFPQWNIYIPTDIIYPNYYIYSVWEDQRKIGCVFGSLVGIFRNFSRQCQQRYLNSIYHIQNNYTQVLRVY